MNITQIHSNYKTILSFKVTGDFHNLTDDELIDCCEPNNFGGYVRSRGTDIAIVDVYID